MDSKKEEVVAQEYAVALREEIKDLIAKGDEESMAICNVETYDGVRARMATVSKVWKEREDRFNEKLCKPIYAVWKTLVAIRDGAGKPIQERVNVWGIRATAWRNEENRRRAEEEQKRIAEARRIQEEQRKRDEEARQAQFKAEEDARLAAAEEAEKRGDKMAAEAILTTPTPVPPPPPPAPMPEPMPAPAAPALAGGVVRWKAEIFDKRAFLRAALDDAELLGTIEVKMAILHQLARAMKNRLNIPGVRAVVEESTRA